MTSHPVKQHILTQFAKRTSMTNSTIADRLEELSKKATPGPWVSHQYKDGTDVTIAALDGRHITDVYAIAFAANGGRHKAVTPTDKANASLIVELVNNLPAVISALRGRESVIEGMVLPSEMTPAIKDALSMMLWRCGSLATAYRTAGFEIPTRAEDEQAFVLWRSLRHAIQHGDQWRERAQAELNDLRAMIKAVKGGEE